MRREISGARALGNVGFVLVVVALVVYGLRQLDRRDWAAQPTFRARSGFGSVGGVGVGTKVRVQGIDAGVVEGVDLPLRPGDPVVLRFRVDRRLRPLVRADARARIAPQGVIGARVVEIVPGRPDAAELAEGAMLASEAPVEMADLLGDASRMLVRVDAVARSAERGLGEINAIAASIRKGEGSLGKLVRDDEAYRRLVSLGERGSRTIDDLGENLAALKRTWPLSRYFNDRAFYDRERVLFKPGSEREGRTLGADDLFERGRSVLTAGGRKRLDDVGAWFARSKRPKSEVVIAAYTDEAGDDPELAQMLTQEQAEAVRKYLIGKFAIDSIGWFGTRKVAAVGFGAEAPRSARPEADAPPRRVEVILFTPQA